MARAKIIAGNWKLNKTTQESLELVKAIHYGLSQPGNTEVIVAPVFTAIKTVADFLKDSYIHVAAQNLFWEESGAFTGEVSAPLIKEAGADHVIIGHSERRQYFGETNETVNKKILAALEHDLTPIVCIGETLEEREANQMETVIEQQLREGLTNINLEKIIIAYEPIWAIGTGKTATPEEAEQAHAFIRNILTNLSTEEIANKISILYGGSVKPDNAKALLQQENIDGALVGGASLKADSFVEIVRSA